MKKVKQLLTLLFAVLMFSYGTMYSQTTTASINGLVVDQNGNPLPGANIIVVHQPSGTKYSTISRDNGRYNLNGLRVGGPYKVTVSFVGYETQINDNVYLNLGVSTDINFTLKDASVGMSEVTVSAKRDAIFSSDRTGAATAITKEAIQVLPTISRRIGDFTKLTPQASGNSFSGQDNRLNNITVDGSYFNNSFGLAGQPGDRTGVSPISIDAIEQVQVNIAPYDVRQGHFVGAGVNTVTKSGSNEYSAATYYNWRTQGLVGTQAKDLHVNPGTFKYNLFGVSLSGPILKNKLFFFANFEKDALVEPGTTFLANEGNQTVGGNVTRVLKSDLDALSSFLKSKFNYETGPYQGYNHETPSLRFIMKFDYNLDDANKITLRYTHLDSDTDVLASNSSSLGFGNRRSNTQALNFQNSNYKIMENIRSLVGEWNSVLGKDITNNLIIGYTFNDESRNSRGSFFPFIDILNGGSTYTSFGFEPFTPNNELRYKSYQLQNNLNIYSGDHTFTFGLSAERYESENVFFPGSQSVYVYNSLADFYTDANDYLANPNRTTSPVTLRRFQVRYMNIPGLDKPLQPLKVWYTGIYGQDEWQFNKDLKFTLGIRFDIPFFGDTGYENPNADKLVFRDENGNPVQYKTKKLPDPKIHYSPRFGFNWDISGDRSTQLRGGTGLFTGTPAYVWISNQIGNTGVLTGFISADNTKNYPFNPNPNKYKPTNVTGAPAASYELALTDPDFKFPQLWRNNLAIDQKLPFDLIATAEFIYSKDVNGIYYINANLPAAQTQFSGVDNRLRWTNTRINNTPGNQVANAIVLKNQSVGYSWDISFALEKPLSDGWFAKVFYRYGESKNTVDAGSIAFGSWNNNEHHGDPNNPGLGFSAYSPGHRIFGVVSYKAEYFNFGATTISLTLDSYTQGNASYVFSGDINGDGGTSNDLIYIPKNKSEMNFETYTVSGRTFTAEEQANAWEAYINQDSYLSKNRGKYAERNAVFLPMVTRMDLSIAQDVFAEFLGKRNTLQFRVDVLNFGNLLNKNWGVGNRFVSTSPLIARGADSQGKALYRLRNIGSSLISKTFESTSSLNDVYRIQFSLRYMFN
ncbi:TonB-dependent receptor [Stygiobacter electus]|uniref:Carboxypeptidase regulatory-like domain-containing protein n=1 Tax=Stygiobacter electus TaxID=3032292 RepID=A0AAE3TCV8_9BACT|nr:carboxypeptidase regulatory-like domain-containing protein [Stygiobacter electus]MDF1610847.1 carboxypeptidase regulatory-like domain-containing protein [Stygiobacter electus]